MEKVAVEITSNIVEGKVFVITDAGSGPGGETSRLLSVLLKTDRQIKTALLFVLLLRLAPVAFSQERESRTDTHIAGVISITNKGISIIPSFTLGKPAVVFDLSMGKRKLSFEPQLRFALEGKPWSFIFWWRYNLLTTKKWRLNIGAHPSFVFRTESVVTDGGLEDVLVVRRYVAGELSSSYTLSPNVNLSTFYLYARGLQDYSHRNTNFVGLNMGLSKSLLSDQYTMSVRPQVYYLKMDEDGGLYFTATFTLSRRDFPLSLSALFNKIIETDISAGEDYLWNVSLTYAYRR